MVRESCKVVNRRFPPFLTLGIFSVDNLKENGVSTVFTYNGSCMAGRKKTGKIAMGHEERFLKAFEEYGDALFRHATFRINDRERAIDVVHDTYTKVWSYIRNGHEIDAFRPFLYKVLNNLIVDEYRRTKELSLDAILETEGIDEGSFEELNENNLETLIATIDGKKAFEVLEKLPDSYREVIIFRFVDELRPREISELIEESENVVSVRIHRGLRMIRDYIEKEEQARDERRQMRMKKKNGT